MGKVKLFRVLIAFSAYEIGSIVSEERLQSNDHNIIDLVNGGVIKPVKEDESKSVPVYPKYMAMTRDVAVPAIARYIHEGNGLYRFKSIILPFEALNNDSRFIPIADDKEFESYSEDDNKLTFDLSDLAWMVENNPENNHSPFAKKMSKGFIAAAVMLNFLKTLTSQ